MQENPKKNPQEFPADFLADFSFRTKTKRFKHTVMNSQEEKKIQRLKPKNRELTGTEMIFKPSQLYNITLYISVS
jgi:hypothetical protein